MRLAVLVSAALLVVLLSVGCGGDDASLPEIDCEMLDSVPAYSELTIIEVCTGCHSSEREGADRGDAPVGVNFDTYAAASASAERGAIRVYAGEMPPAGTTATAAQKQQFYEWALCGTPE
jgi:hypothetical protein